MSEQHAQRVFCHRLKKELPVGEHERCPYCYGIKEGIETGDHEKFCDFDPDKDPTHFGDDSGAGRMDRG